MPKSKKRKSKGGAARPLELHRAKAMFMAHYNAGRLAEALGVVEPLIARGNRDPAVLADAAVACVYLERWNDAISYGKQAVALAPKNLPALDAVAHAAGAIRDWDLVKSFGRRALSERDALAMALPQTDRTPLGVASGATKQVISFSLFGGSSKYCETAILNCVEQPTIYPGWECWFYTDGSVPVRILERLEHAGGRVIKIDPTLARWPGPMWRFAAYDDPDVITVIFRDADSVISQREAGAVKEWLASDCLAHAMRDNGSHTELLLAGLWGIRKGALPRIGDMVAEFLQTKKPDMRFADQLFLREQVWPKVRHSLFEHDSVFERPVSRPFPEGPHRDDFHVGYAEGSPFLTISTQQPDGSEVTWYLREGDKEICRYSASVKHSKVIAHVPARFARAVQNGTMQVGLDLG